MNSTSSQSDRLRRVQSLIQEIAGKGKDVSLDDVESCRQLVETSRRLCCELESPSEAVFRIVIVQPVLSMAIRTAVQLNLFTAMEGEGKPRHTVKELAAHTGADPVLLSRIMSQMAAMDFLREIGPNSYELTHVSKCLRDQIYQDPFKYTYEITIPVLRMTSQYLAETKYTNPSIFRDTPFQMAHRTKQSLYEYFVSHPEIGGQFSNFMIMINQGRPQWFDADHFPVQKLLGSEANIKDDKDVLMVDIGGGQGQDVTLFRKRYPDLSGRLILQDTPQVIQQAGDLPHGIEGMPYNFFTPQPIKGAKVYYLHQVLHAFPETECLEILANLVPALQRDYSKVLIHEVVIPDQHPHYLSTTMDLLMMCHNATEEWKESKWEQLLRQAGLKVVKFWHFQPGMESVIEAELA